MDGLLYTASARLGLWDTLSLSSDDFGALNRMLQSAAHGVVESAKMERTKDPALAGVAAVCDKLIARGNPTLVDLDFELALLSAPALRILRAREIDKGPTVGMRLTEPLPFNIDDLVRATGEASHLAVPPRRFAFCGPAASPAGPTALDKP